MNKQLITLNDIAAIKYADLLKKVPFGQSNFQTNNFVLNKEYTPHRQLRQILLQYDQLCYTLIETQIKQKQSAVEIEQKYNEIDKLKAQLDTNQDNFQRKDLQLKISKVELEVEQIILSQAQIKKLIEDALADKQNFEKQLEKIVPQVEQLEANGIDFEKAEQMYWTARFTEDARLTMFTVKTGHQIDKEILRSIIHMDEETRNVVLSELGIDNQMIENSGLLTSKNSQLLFLKEIK